MTSFTYYLFTAFSVLCVATALLAPIGVVQAATVLIGDKISIEADDVVEDDYYVSVGPIGSTVMSGTVEGDMYVLSGQVTTNGSIKGDFGAITGLSYMHASVTDDVRIVAAEVVIDDYVGGDVFVLAGNLKILSTATIKGDVIFYGIEGEINGSVGGSVYGTMDKLRIDTAVGGDIDVKATRELTLGSKANITGDIRYRSHSDLVRAQDSIVEGEIQHQMLEAERQTDSLRSMLIPMFISLFAALTLYLLFKKEIEQIIKVILQSPLQAGLIGLATLAAGPFVSLLLISTVLGMLLGFFGVGAMLVLISIGFALSIILTGALLSKMLVHKPTISLVWILSGAVVFHSLLQLPFIGALVALALVTMTMGGILLSIYRRLG